MNKSTKVLACLAGWVLILPAVGHGQEINLNECFEKKFGELLPLFDLWNAKKLMLRKQEFGSEFQEQIRASAEGKPASWATSRIGLWESLKPELEPQLPLSTGAQLVLLGLYEQNQEGFLKEVEGEDRRRRQFTLKLYLILSISQEAARKAESNKIQSSHVAVAVQQAWTGLWPFCPRK